MHFEIQPTTGLPAQVPPSRLIRHCDVFVWG
jgi:hypothetical protein